MDQEEHSWSPQEALRSLLMPGMEVCAVLIQHFSSVSGYSALAVGNKKLQNNPELLLVAVCVCGPHSAICQEIIYGG